MKQFWKKVIVSILTSEARFLLRRHQPKIIAITGSVGKTSMKDAVYTVLKNHYVVRKSEKSFNSEIGIPLTILGLPNGWDNPFLWLKNIIDGAWIALFTKQYPEVLVIEAGVDRPGDMERLTQWLTPDVTVLTRLPDVPVHVEYFSSPEAVVEEKWHLVQALKADGVLVYNHDDVLIKSRLSEVRQQAIGYSRDLPAQCTAQADEVLYKDDTPIGFQCGIAIAGEKVTVRMYGVVGVQNCYTIAGAFAVGHHFGISMADMVRDFGEYVPPPGRMRLLAGIKGTTIIDDSYNSSPIAAESALLTLKEIVHAKRRIAVLGDMLELGKFASREHERVGELVPSCADVLVTLGIRSQKTAEAALAHGVSEKNIFQHDDVARAGRELQNYIQPGDVILVKGSQGVRAERVVEEIMLEPERAGELLVRQDTAWQKRKSTVG